MDSVTRRIDVPPTLTTIRDRLEAALRRPFEDKVEQLGYLAGSIRLAISDLDDAIKAGALSAEGVLEALERERENASWPR